MFSWLFCHAPYRVYNWTQRFLPASFYTWHWFYSFSLSEFFLFRGKFRTSCCHACRHFLLCAGVSNIVQWKITGHGETHSSIVIYCSFSWQRWEAGAQILPVSSACWFPAVQSSSTWLKAGFAAGPTGRSPDTLAAIQLWAATPSAASFLFCLFGYISSAEDSGSEKASLTQTT